MLRLLFLFLTLITISYSSDKVEVFATDMDTKDNIVHASGDVAVVYKEYFLTASRAKYNRNTGDLELFDNVRANKNGEHKILGNYARMNIINKERTFEPFYMLDEKSDVWISSDKGCALDKDMDLSSGVMSGCNPNDPLWQMEFSESDYNFDDKWLNLYNARLYFYDIPIFYTPWFGYSLDTTRRTGLLMPSFGYSGTEGAFYEQPIYIAEYDSWDLELNPQIRTNRGYGLYSTFRFADSPVSQGELTLGYFKEQDDYFKENNLVNQTHSGFNFKYDNKDFINQWFGLNLDGQSGIYADISDMNDVDYINLASNSVISNNSTATQIFSKINMFYNNDSNYIGAYFKYYKNLTVDSNSETLQNLPILHYHHYLETMLDDHVLYNIDVQSNNYYREKNKKVIQTDISLPVVLQTSLFDEYLDVSYTANLYAQQSSFSGYDERAAVNDIENGYILKNDHKISLSTHLTKAYDNFTHVISPDISYTFDGGETSSGFYLNNREYCQDVLNRSQPLCEFYNITDVQESVDIGFSQYIYNVDGQQVLYHRLSQSVLYDEDKKFIYGDANTLGDLESELEYKITDNLSFYNNMFYNHELKRLSKNYNRITYNDNSLRISIGHMYKNTFKDYTYDSNYQKKYIPRTSYITSSIDYKYNSRYTYYASQDYDEELHVQKRLEFGFMYKKRCWDFGISYVNNLRPSLVTGPTGKIQTEGIRERYIYFSIALKPFMQTNRNTSFLSYKLPENSDD